MKVFENGVKKFQILDVSWLTVVLHFSWISFVVDVPRQAGEAEGKIDGCGGICLKVTLPTLDEVHQG